VLSPTLENKLDDERETPPPPPPRKARWSRSPVHRRRRRILAGVAVVLAACLIWLAVSLGGALTNPALGSSMSARLAEWAREHGGASVVNWAENEWYSHHQPKVGGALAPGTIQKPKAVQTTPAVAAVPHLPVPGRRVSLRDDTIKLSGVSLVYPGRDRQALTAVNLVIRPGDQITLAGPSGAGKSSLLALLLRFAEPTGGRIEVGGVDLASIPVGDWRRQISWVPQQPYLFNTSVAANIALGQPAATQEAIARAAQAAGAAEFIEGLPDGYATEVSERGLRLSSGQRQQIALARAFLRDAPLLLLDEPTAHLDAVSARELEQAIARLTTDRTVIQVTHSQNETRDIGRLFTLDHGTLRQASSPCPAPSAALLAATS